MRHIAIATTAVVAKRETSGRNPPCAPGVIAFATTGSGRTSRRYRPVPCARGRAGPLSPRFTRGGLGAGRELWQRRARGPQAQRRRSPLDRAPACGSDRSSSESPSAPCRARRSAGWCTGHRKGFSGSRIMRIRLRDRGRQGVSQSHERTGLGPAQQPAVHRAPGLGGEWQVPPGVAGTKDGEDTIEHVTLRPQPRATCPSRRGQQRGGAAHPASLRQIAKGWFHAQVRCGQRVSTSGFSGERQTLP